MIITCSSLGGIVLKLKKTVLDGKLKFWWRIGSFRAGLLISNYDSIHFRYYVFNHRVFSLLLLLFTVRHNLKS